MLLFAEMLASIGNVMLAARSETAIRLEELNAKDMQESFVKDVQVDDDVVDSDTDDVQHIDTNVELDMMKVMKIASCLVQNTV